MDTDANTMQQGREEQPQQQQRVQPLQAADMAKMIAAAVQAAMGPLAAQVGALQQEFTALRESPTQDPYAETGECSQPAAGASYLFIVMFCDSFGASYLFVVIFVYSSGA